MRATVVFWTWPLYDTPGAGFFVSLTGSVNAVNVCVRMWKDTDGDIAYLVRSVAERRQLCFEHRSRRKEKPRAAHKYGLAVGVNDLIVTCAEFGGLPPGCGRIGDV